MICNFLDFVVPQLMVLGLENQHYYNKLQHISHGKLINCMALKTLLNDALGGTSVEVIPCVEQTAKIPENQTLRLALSGCHLGIDSYLGDELIDRMGKFRISLGPLNRAEFKRFSPGTEDFSRVSSLTDLYFVEPLKYEIEIILAKGEAQTVCLGDAMRATLGVDSWIFSSDELGEVRAIFNPQH